MTIAQILLALVVVIVVALAIYIWRFLGIWVAAQASGVPVPIISLVGMQLRRVSPSRIIYPLIKVRKAGLQVIQNKLEAHYLAGGNVDKVVDALIAADKAGIPLTFDQATMFAVASGCSTMFVRRR